MKITINDANKIKGLNPINFKHLPINICKGAVIGVGAILPGVSGGVLCVAFGVYEPMMYFLSHPIKAFRSHYRLLLPVLMGWVIGFLGLARGVEYLFRTSQSPAIWLFIGLIAGTLPSLYRSAGKKGRTRGSWVALALCFVVFFTWMIVFVFTKCDSNRALRLLVACERDFMEHGSYYSGAQPFFFPDLLGIISADDGGDCGFIPHSHYSNDCGPHHVGIAVCKTGKFAF